LTKTKPAPSRFSIALSITALSFHFIDVLLKLRTLLNSGADLHGAMKSGDVTAEQITCSSSRSRTNINLASLNLTSVNLSASAGTDRDRQGQTPHNLHSYEHQNFEPKQSLVNNFPKFLPIDASYVDCRKEKTTVILVIVEVGEFVEGKDGSPLSPAHQLKSLGAVGH